MAGAASPLGWVVLLLTLCALARPACSQACDSGCRIAQRAALEQLYNATDGACWRSSAGWRTAADHCTWFGVACGAGGGVARLALPSNGLAGPLPSAALPPLSATLEQLDLSGNALRGAPPPGLADLAALQRLDLSNNSLSGPLPGGWAGGWAAAEEVDLSRNQLEPGGALPPGLALDW